MQAQHNDPSCKACYSCIIAKSVEFVLATHEIWQNCCKVSGFHIGQVKIQKISKDHNFHILQSTEMLFNSLESSCPGELIGVFDFIHRSWFSHLGNIICQQILYDSAHCAVINCKQLSLCYCYNSNMGGNVQSNSRAIFCCIMCCRNYLYQWL